MNTKKDILKWWEERGKIKDYSNPESVNDLKNFTSEIDLFKVKIEHTKTKKHDTIRIDKGSWKYPLYLFFHKKEAVKISGF